MTFATPWLVWLAAAAPFAVAALQLYDRARRRTLTRRLGELPVVGKVIASASPGRRIAKDALAGAAAMLILLAAARPQIAGTRQVELHGLDLVVAVDVSKSMLVDDVGPTREMTTRHLEPSRLARARELARAVIDELPGDRIAPVVFAAAAAHFPLTEDHLVASNFLRDLGPSDLPPGSNLAEVFRVARCLLRPDLYDDLGCARIGRRGHGGDPLHGESLDPRPRERDAAVEQKVERGKAILVFSDGGDSDPTTLREVAIAHELGIAVFLVGLGTPTGGVVHDVDEFTGKRTAAAKRLADGSTVVSRRDDAGMTALAAAAGDAKRYFAAADHGEVDPMPIVDALRAVNRGLATKRVKDLRDIYQPFLFAALMLLVIEATISTRRRQRYPEAA
ncbi:MAG TPA: VWA domain-containing protein [Kofleriaceae bacterium]|nr:VWA domain-containing protein [Kofleriaceae bacterium]HMG56547.1 VWA domain-containing protein [Kofleriaceae bacterium]